MLTLVRPEPSCGGRDLEAAVTLALDVARFPVEHKNEASGFSCSNMRKQIIFGNEPAAFQ